MKKNCDTCKWNVKEDCTHIQSITNCPLPTYPLWESNDESKEETIKEIATNYANYNAQMHEAIKAAVIFGAKQQNEIDSKTMYTESEMKQLITNAFVQMSDWKNEGKETRELEILIDNWFNENKKKHEKI